MRSLPSLVVPSALIVALSTSLIAQSSPATPSNVAPSNVAPSNTAPWHPADVAPTPGARAGTERWIVHFAKRSFELDTLRDAYRRGAKPTEIEAIADKLAARADHDTAEFTEFCARCDARIIHRWWLINACAIEATPADLDRIRAHRSVLRLEPDRSVRPGEFIRTSTNANNHGTDLVQARGVLGTGVTVAFVDSGLDSNMNGSGRPHRSFYVDGDPSNQTGGGLGGSRILANVQVGFITPDDSINHGTPVAAVAVGEVWSHPLADRGHAPRAGVVGYSVADLPGGLASASTLIAAYQQITIDAARYGIDVVNCSYEGIFDPGFSDQVAIDQMVNVTDVVFVGMGGNGGASAAPGFGATNMTAVGAVIPDTRQVASFSSRGPLPDDPRRTYPDLVANGVNIQAPAADNEAAVTFTLGTSYSSPQVAGAAALYRSIRPTALATEVKAAILATTEDVAARNSQPPFNTANAYGAGYLHVPNLVYVAEGRGLRADGALSNQNPTAVYSMQVAQGRRYGVAVAWFRLLPAINSWSNLDLSVSMNGQTLISATNERNTAEHVRFVAPSTGVVSITVHAVGFGPNAAGGQPFSMVATDIDPNFTVGTLTEFGNSCATAGVFPQLTAPLGERPEIGRAYSLSFTDNAFIGQSAIMLLGISNTTWNGVSLPLDLGPFGAPNCRLLVSGEIGIPVPFHQGGPRLVQIFVPADPALIGASVYHQVVATNVNNPLGVATSNGVEAVLGG